ncbi:MAG TPA: restriction endonuclease [Ignavibacteriales bacterium]|nr:restriction endonuclease [Ignavibacteriales bacterium]
MNNLPPKWSWVKLGDVCEIVMGQSPPSSTYNTEEIGLPFFQGKAEFTELYPIVRKWCSKPNKIAEPLDILISVRAPVGSSNIANLKCCIGRGLAALRYPDCNKYIFYYIRLSETELDKLGTGSTFKAISSTTLRNFEIPLPSLPEQKKIVEKIEELFSRLDDGVASLKKAKAQIRLYRQSVLASAFSGKLINGERLNGIQEVSKAAEPKVNYSIQLPNGWKWVKLGEVIDSMQYGTSDKAIGNETGIPVLRMGNIQDGKLDYSSLKYFDKSFEDLDKYLLEDGDILFNRTNSAELVGKSAIYKKHHPKSIFASYLIRVKVTKTIYSPEFLNYYINSSYGRDFIKSVVSQNVGQANVNGTKLKGMQIPLVPLNQQTQIVEEIEKRFSEADNLEKAIDESLVKSETLRQSILKQAFEGKLI